MRSAANRSCASDDRHDPPDSDVSRGTTGGRFRLERRYGLALASVWRDGLTLGDVFRRTRPQ